MGHAVLESVPQSLLQSVFIMRTFIKGIDSNDDNNSGIRNDLQTTDILILFLSVVASIVSIASKYIVVDASDFVNGNGGQYATEESKNANLCSRNNECVLINFGYVVRSLWRIGSVTARVSIYSLVWSVMGGAFIIGYAIVEFLLAFIFIGCVDTYFEQKEQFLFMIVAMIAIYFEEDAQERLFFYLRLFDDILLLCIIIIFSFYKFNCSFCSNSENRNIDKNIAVRIYIIISAISIVIYSVSLVVGAIIKPYIRRVWERDGKFCASVEDCLTNCDDSHLCR